MSWIFGSGKTDAEKLKENQKQIRKAEREIDREIKKLDREEKTVVMEIKRLAREQKFTAAKTQATFVVRIRNQTNQLYSTKTSLKTLSMQLQSLRTTEAMSRAMKESTRAMIRTNRMISPEAMARIIQQFEYHADIMEAKQEIMDDSLNAQAEGDMDFDAEATSLLMEISEGIGIAISDELANVPDTNLKTAMKNTAAIANKLPDGNGGGVVSRKKEDEEDEKSAEDTKNLFIDQDFKSRIDRLHKK